MAIPNIAATIPWANSFVRYMYVKLIENDATRRLYIPLETNSSNAVLVFLDL